MSYQWDNKKPTTQMLGRWQPFHDVHYALFEKIIKKTGQVCIQIRDVQGIDDNPFDFETVKKNIEKKLNTKYEGRFKIILVPNITNIFNRGKVSVPATNINNINILAATELSMNHRMIRSISF